MRRLLSVALVLFVAVSNVTGQEVPFSNLIATQLRCEFQDDPPAIQATQPRFSWILKPASPSLRGTRQTAYRILVASSPNLLQNEEGDLWDSSKVRSAQTIQIPYQGKPLLSMGIYYWAVRVWDENGRPSAWSQPERFRMGLLSPTDWKAHWIGTGTPSHERTPLPVFRYEFDLAKSIAEARAFVSGLGQYEFHLNGEKVGDAVLTPGWTNYRKTVFYNTYDITRLLRVGRNAIGILLGNGMYNVEKTPGRYTKFVGSFGPLKLIFQAEIRFTDGTSLTIISSDNWRFHAGPIVFSSIYGGEDYDARLEMAGWDLPGFDDRNWPQAVETEGPGGELVSQQEPPIEIQHIYTPQKVMEPRPGVRVYDLGQNFAGWPAITVRGSTGSTVKLIPGELLDASGLVMQLASGRPQWFSYVLKGDGVENWHPRFSYYGFRYLQIETQAPAGLPEPQIISVRGEALHAAAETVGYFHCSKDLFNRIHRLINAAIENNMQSVLTDCPHREKLGWLEQSHLVGASVMDNYDVLRLYEAISQDMGEAQTPEGLVPDIAPEYVIFSNGFRDSPEWGSAVILDPWLTFRYYADRRNLAMHYEDMKRYLAYLRNLSNQNIVSYGLGDWYDIGPKPSGFSQLTSPGVTATATYYQDVITMQRIASLLGKKKEADQFERVARAIRQAFNEKWYDPINHCYDRGSQTDYAMPLALGIAPPQDRPLILERLIQDIRAHQNHTTAGEIGFHYVIETLFNSGRSDVIFDMLSRTDPPSYGSQLLRGATALTEAWDANPIHSQDHFMLGSAEDWFYRGLAGLDFDLARPQEQQIIIHPWPVGDVREAEARYRSILGEIAVHWKIDGTTFLLDVQIPPNRVATVYLPTSDSASVTEAGKPVHILRYTSGIAVCRIKSGIYHFQAQH